MTKPITSVACCALRQGAFQLTRPIHRYILLAGNEVGGARRERAITLVDGRAPVLCRRPHAHDGLAAACSATRPMSRSLRRCASGVAA